MHNKKFVLFAAILYTILVTYLSLAVISAPAITKELFDNQDKIVHFTFYFIFTFIWFEATKQAITTKKKVLILVFIAVLYGVAMEFCQAIFTNYRSPDKWDAFANSLGAIFAGILIIRFKLKKT